MLNKSIHPHIRIEVDFTNGCKIGVFHSFEMCVPKLQNRSLKSDIIFHFYIIIKDSMAVLIHE